MHTFLLLFFFSSRRRHTIWPRDWSSDVCSSDLRVQSAAPSPSNAPGTAMDLVLIEALKVDTVIGVYDWERTMTQTLVLDRSEERRVGREGRSRWARGE